MCTTVVSKYSATLSSLTVPKLGLCFCGLKNISPTRKTFYDFICRRLIRPRKKGWVDWKLGKAFSGKKEKKRKIAVIVGYHFLTNLNKLVIFPENEKISVFGGGNHERHFSKKC